MTDHKLATLPLQHMLASDDIASVMVAMTTVHEVENNVRPSQDRERDLSWQDVL